MTKKLLPRYIGPYKIVKQKSSVTYLVEDIPAMRKRKVWRRFLVHVSQMKPFKTPQDDEWTRNHFRTDKIEAEIVIEKSANAVKRTRSGRPVISSRH
jgi:hypothetical protein